MVDNLGCRFFCSLWFYKGLSDTPLDWRTGENCPALHCPCIPHTNRARQVALFHATIPLTNLNAPKVLCEEFFVAYFLKTLTRRV